MSSVIVLFLLICRKHYQRHIRYIANQEIDQLLLQLKSPELFRESNVEFHHRLRHYYDRDYLDLLYAWVRICQQLLPRDRDVFVANSERCGLYERIPQNLNNSHAARICVALEVCGLAKLTNFIEEVERYTWRRIYAPFACHALVRMNFEEGMESLFRAYGHQLVNNAELLIICAEVTQDRVALWAKQSSRWPLPEVLQKYWVRS